MPLYISKYVPYVIGSGNIGILPPPPGGSAVPRLTGPPPGVGSRPGAAANTKVPSSASFTPTNASASNPPSDWGDFTTAQASNQQ